jgi:hypothetical protein
LGPYIRHSDAISDWLGQAEWLFAGETTRVKGVGSHFAIQWQPRSHFASHTDNSLGTWPKTTSQGTWPKTLQPSPSWALGPRQPETAEKFPCATRVEGSHVIAHTSEQGSYTTRLRCPINRLAHHATPHGSNQVLSHSVILMS